jgi:hypothetical protein
VDEPPRLDDRYALSPQAVAAFGRDGHVRVDALASPDEAAWFRPVVEEVGERIRWDRRPLSERDTYGQAFVQSANLWRHDDRAARFTLSPRFAGAAAALLGVPAVRIYHDQALIKEAGGGPTPWHQDQFYWPLATHATVTLWMPLVPVEDPVEGMTFADGSDRLGDLGGGAISDASEAHFDEVVGARGLPLTTYGSLAPGDATFHRGWTLHRASANPTDTPRTVMTVIYVADGATIAAPENPAQELDRQLWLGGAAPGDPVGGDLNPRVGGA